MSLDKWDLKEGHDALAFMEQMVSDPTVSKVIIVSDKIYTEKADGRRGGVGTETQIISPEIYAKARQDKFCVVVAELDAEGRPYLPTYYRSRIYVDLSNDDAYATNYDKLLRWIFGKPANPKPSLGRPPSFLTDEHAPVLPVDSKFRRAIDGIKQSSPNSIGFLRDYLDALSENFEGLRLSQKNDPQFDEAVVRSIEGFLPYRNEYLEVIRSIAQSNVADAHIETVHRFFERISPYLTMPPEGTRSWSSRDFDNYRFIISELFLYTVSLLLRYERFPFVALLLNSKYYLEHEVQYGRDFMRNFGVLWQQADSLENRNVRLQLNKLSLRAGLLEQRSRVSGIDFRYLMQGDFTLFLRDAKFAVEAEHYLQWWPETLVYGSRLHAPFEIYARAESRRYFDKLKTVFDIQEKNDFTDLIEAFKRKKLGLPRSESYWAPDPVILMNYEKLASVP